MQYLQYLEYLECTHTSTAIEILALFNTCMQRVYGYGGTGKHEMYVYTDHHMDQHWGLQGKLNTVKI